MAHALREHGVSDWRIWRDGRHVFHLVEVDDYQAMRAALRDHPANVAWQEPVGPLFDVPDNYGDADPVGLPVEPCRPARRSRRSRMAVTDDAIQAIKQMILAGELRPGDRLPPETDLADRSASPATRCGRRSRRSR